MLDNILMSKLYRPGRYIAIVSVKPERELFCRFSVAYVSRSGGMSNELNNIISGNSDGVYEGIAIGGDRSVNSYQEKIILSCSISVIQVQHSPIISSDTKLIPKPRSLFFSAKLVSSCDIVFTSTSLNRLVVLKNTTSVMQLNRNV